ncbi:MAG: indolepyruvate ferredoxin oxidoreductase subunit alpha, partial [Clostridia bacterium]|nr:indolepyruvate ferredoxin oxidoreductase subunit alpha [Clostridia bacterium]
MGNGATALGALAAGVNLVAGYPGTPSSEIIETISKYPHDGVHLEWSVNEKAALEVAAAAAYSGARALVTMKQMGLNVASDPLMSVAYVGVKGGLV